MRASTTSRRGVSTAAFLGAVIAMMTLPVFAGSLGRHPADDGARMPAAHGPADQASVTMNVFPDVSAVYAAPVSPEAPDQANIARFVSESWESNTVFLRGSNWRTFDPFVSQPSLNDMIRWDRRNCDATVGSYSLWSVGGGSVGSGYTCGANYPSPVPERPNQGIRTELQYLYLNFGAVPAVGGLRVTFDYKSRMPQNALFVGAGDFDSPNADGSIPIRGSNSMTADTQGDWERGYRVEIRDSQGFQITGKTRILFAMVYSDPPPAGQGVPSSGMFGVYVDNIHLDAMFVANPGIIPSPPTPTVETPTPTPTVKPTSTGLVFPTTAVPKHHEVALPVALDRHQAAQLHTPVPTAPTATVTNTSPPPTPTATETLAPTDTPTATLVPTRTPVPEPDVKFEIVAPLDDPEVVKVTNFGTAPQDMTNWRVFEFKNAKTCMFPSGLILGPGETHTMLSGRKSAAGEGVTICDDARLIWDNNLDEAQLWSERNDRVDRWCYDRFGPIPCTD